MTDWIAATPDAKTAAIRVYHADNQVVVVVNGENYSARWDSGWTSGDPDLGGVPVEFPLPDRGYIDVTVLGANGGVGGIDPYNFKTQIVIPGRPALPITGRSSDNGPPGLQYDQTFRIFRPYQKMENDGVPTFESNINLHQRICPIHSINGKFRTYLCRVFLADSGAGGRVGFEFRIKETDGIFKSLSVPYLCRKNHKGDDGDDLPRIDYLDMEIDKYDDPPSPLISADFINHGTNMGANDIFAFVMVEFLMGHRVSAGETLRKIAKEIYNDEAQWQKIYNANVGVIGANPDALQVGQILEIPD